MVAVTGVLPFQVRVAGDGIDGRRLVVHENGAEGGNPLPVVERIGAVVHILYGLALGPADVVTAFQIEVSAQGLRVHQPAAYAAVLGALVDALVYNFRHARLVIHIIGIGERLVVAPQAVVGDVPVHIGADGTAGHAQTLAEQEETAGLEVPVVTGIVGKTVVGAIALDIFPGVEHRLLQVAAPAEVELRLEQDGSVLAELVLQAHAKAVAVREAVTLAVRVRVQRTAIGQIGFFIGILRHVHDGAVVQVVAAQVHFLVQEVPVAVHTAHPGGGDTVGAAPATATHTAHAATAAHHGVHHGAGEVVEPTVVGVVAIEDDADLAVLRKAAAHGRRLPAGCIRTTGCGQVHAAAHHGIAKQAVHHAPFHGKVDDGFFFAVVNARKLCLLALFLHHFHLLDEFGGDVLRSQLRVV